MLLQFSSECQIWIIGYRAHSVSMLSSLFLSSRCLNVFTGVPAALGAGPAGAAATLTDEEADEFEDMLRSLSMERADVQRAMGFALDHAAAALDVVETVVESLTLAETPLPTKVARLYLVRPCLYSPQDALLCVRRRILYKLQSPALAGLESVRSSGRHCQCTGAK